MDKLSSDMLNKFALMTHEDENDFTWSSDTDTGGGWLPWDTPLWTTLTEYKR